MKATDAILIGWERQENLGLRYIVSYLETQGYRARLLPYSRGRDEDVVRATLEAAPGLVGFSIIFQYDLLEFGALMRALRGAGVGAHFTAGGHFPSLRPESTLGALPELDSVVRFEGELTTAELIARLDRPDTWPGIRGLAFHRGNELVVNAARPLIEDLDSVPWPARGETLQTARGIPMAPILASRGCLFDCSFCSIRQFYGGAPGPLRRTRSPEDVASEMRFLYETRGVRLFLFQDDDFASRTARQRAWVNEFLAALDREDLTGRIGWKISCRVDDVDPDLVARCRERGLLAVYLGVESGSSEGLRTLNKHVSREQNWTAIRTLQKAGVELDMGFMLLDPGSTLQSVGENIAFLRGIASMSGPPVCFVKTLPLAGTAMERSLAAEGRLTGDPLRPDYRFQDPRLDYYALWITLRFSARNSAPDGLVDRLRAAYFDQLVAREFERADWVEDYGYAIRQLIDRANESGLRTLERSLEVVESCPDADGVAKAWRYLNEFAAEDAEVQANLFDDLDRVLERYSPALCGAMRENEPAMA